ncbi:MAG: hypothetical protein QOE36_2959 [Gaiellaceae bacterium]|jgi:hypothetical protein|nr:hypothetical protein [Gaiellaceae bacterium]
MDESIRIQTPSVADALFLVRALSGFKTNVIEQGEEAQVEVRPDLESDRFHSSVLTTAANWLADRDLKSTAVHVGGRRYYLLPERDDFRRGSGRETGIYVG